MRFEIQPEPWMKSALCPSTDPEAFFPEQGASVKDAKRVCAQCPVRAECLEFAMRTDQRFGVFGGLSEKQRRRLRRGDVSVLEDRALWRCESCGISLTFKGRVCSSKCRHALSMKERPPRLCVECRAPIDASSPRNKYCSSQCRQKVYDRKRPNRGATRMTLACKQCGAEFTGTRGSRYCSGQCRAAGRDGTGWQEREIICADCRTPFIGKGGRATYCSPACRHRAQYRRKLQRETA